MKKIIRRFWGIALIVILLSTLFVGGTVQPASADTLAWSQLSTPDTTGITNQVVNSTGYGTSAYVGQLGLDVANVVVASDGTLFCLDSVAKNRVYKSVDGGYTWTPSVNLTASTSTNSYLTDIAVSPSYATDQTVFALYKSTNGLNGTGQAYISTNGGLNFNVLGGALASGNATSIAVAPTYNAGNGEVAVATNNGTNSWIYFWGRNGVLNWDAATAPYPTGNMYTYNGGNNSTIAYKVAYSPNFALDQTRLVVSANTTTQLTLNTLVGSDTLWNNMLYYPPTPGAATPISGTNGVDKTITSVSIAFPSDFNASTASLRTCYVGTSSTNTTEMITAVTIGSSPINCALMHGISDQAVTSLAFAGTSTSGTLFAGMRDSTNVESIPVASATSTSAYWGYPLNLPSGTGTTYVAVDPNYASTMKVYAGTAGADSAFSVSTDGSVDFYQTGLIDTEIDTVDDFQAVSSTNMYMVTTNSTGPNTTSVWETTNGGANWNRCLVVADATGGTGGIIRISPNYATDYTVALAIVSKSPPYNMQVSNNAGLNWTAKSTPTGFKISDLAMKDQYNYYIGNDAALEVQATTNGGWTWQPQATTVGTLSGSGGPKISSLKYDVASGALLAGDGVSTGGGYVFLSTDGNKTWTTLGGQIIGNAPAPGDIAIAFDANYATNGFMYALPIYGGYVYRFGTGYVNWLALGAGAFGTTSLLTTPDGTLYTANTTAGINRTLNPTAGSATSAATPPPGVEWSAAGTNLPGGASVDKLAYAAGSNVIYGIVSGLTYPAVYVYSDTLTTSTAAATTALTGPTNGTVIPSTKQVDFTWNAIPGALSYEVMVSDRADFASVGIDATIPSPVTDDFITGLTAGKTYYWMVRAKTPVLGPWSAPQTLLTQLAATTSNAPEILGGGGSGSTANGGYNVALSPTFNWGYVEDATGYAFQLSKGPDFTVAATLIVDLTGANALGNVNAYLLTSPLNYSTTYYWRVMGISATSSSDWSPTVAFTTMAAPTTAPPPVTITQAAAPTINVPQATSTQIVITQAPTKEINPTYIWAIIIIGAVLVLAVIVLIVRTRRSV